MKETFQAKGPWLNFILDYRFNDVSQRPIYLQELNKKYGPVTRMNIGPFTVKFFTRPESVEKILLQRENFVKISEKTSIRMLLGNGLLTSEGDFWLKQRRLIQPIFHKQKLDGFVLQMEDCIQSVLNEWQENPDKKRDVLNEMNKLTLDIVNTTLFSTDIQDRYQLISQAISGCLELMQDRIKYVRVPMWVPIPLHRALNKHMEVLDSTIKNIIRERKNETSPKQDLLSMLMEVQDADTLEKMSEQQIRDEVLTIFIAGHETTANALTFAIYLLSRHPDIKAKMFKEIDEAMESSQSLSYSGLQQLTYTTLIAKEAMRLYPPAWIIPREAPHDTIVDGYRIRQGEKVLVSPYVMHRHPDYWEQPEKFIPERFLSEHFKKQHKYVYFPFGGGARLCVGNNFAMMELQIILARIYQQFDITVPENYKMELSPSVTLRPKHDMPMHIIKRK